MNGPAMQRLIAELRQSGISDENVLGAIASVDRERFVSATFAERAWENTALPIAFGPRARRGTESSSSAKALALAAPSTMRQGTTISCEVKSPHST